MEDTRHKLPYGLGVVTWYPEKDEFHLDDSFGGFIDNLYLRFIQPIKLYTNPFFIRYAKRKWLCWIVGCDRTRENVIPDVFGGTVKFKTCVRCGESEIINPPIIQIGNCF